jgi:AcrR family transcriptional regulator
MSEVTRRKRDSEVTRAAIFEAARDVFVERGYAGASMRTVARQAGVTHGTIYLYFRDKDDLLYQLGEEHFRLLLDRLRTIPRTLEPQARLREMLRTILRFGLEYPNHYHVMLSMRPPHLAGAARRFGPLAEDVLGSVFDAVRRYAERSRLDMADPRTETNVLLALVHGVVELHRDAVLDPGDAETIGEQGIDLLLAGMAQKRS